MTTNPTVSQDLADLARGASQLEEILAKAYRSMRSAPLASGERAQLVSHVGNVERALKKAREVLATAKAEGAMPEQGVTKTMGVQAGTSRPGRGQAFDDTRDVVDRITLQTAAMALSLRTNRPQDIMRDELDREIRAHGGDFLTALGVAKSTVLQRVRDGLLVLLAALSASSAQAGGSRGGVIVEDGAVVCMGGSAMVIDGQTRSCMGNNVLFGNEPTDSCVGGSWNGYPCSFLDDCLPGGTCTGGPVLADLVDKRMGGENQAPIPAENNQWGEVQSVETTEEMLARIHGQGLNEASIDWAPVCPEVPCGGGPGIPIVPGLTISGVTLSGVTISAGGE